MTLAEMRQGALDANWGPRKYAVLEAYLADFSVLHSDSLLCSMWAAVRNESTQKGHPISSADAWIAATALVLSAPLVTNNSKDYRHLDKLRIILRQPSNSVIPWRFSCLPFSNSPYPSIIRPRYIC